MISRFSLFLKLQICKINQGSYKYLELITNWDYITEMDCDIMPNSNLFILLKYSNNRSLLFQIKKFTKLIWITSKYLKLITNIWDCLIGIDCDIN